MNKSRQRIQVRLTASVIEDGDGRVLGFLEAVENLGAVSDRLSAGVESVGPQGTGGVELRNSTHFSDTSRYRLD